MKYVMLQSWYGAGVFHRRGDIIEVGAGEKPPPLSAPLGAEAPKPAAVVETLADHAPPIPDAVRNDPPPKPAGVPVPEPVRNDPPPMVAPDRPARRRRVKE